MTVVYGLPWLFFVTFAIPALISERVRRRRAMRFRALEQIGTWTKGVVAAGGRSPGFRRQADDASWLVVDFRDNAGIVHRIHSKSVSTAFPQNGSQVDVLYDPAHPAAARIRDDYETSQRTFRVLAIVFGGISALALVAGVIVVIASSVS